MLAWFKALSLGKKLAIGTATLFTGAVIAAPATEEIDTAPPPEPTPQVQPAVTEEPVPVITTDTVTETEPIPYETERRNDPDLAQGTTRTDTTGQPGEKTFTYEIEYTDGIETDRTLISEEITRQPTNKIIRVGTYTPPPPQQTQTSSPAQTSSGYVKKSRNDICHAPGTTYYNRTLHYTRYNNIQDCLNSGGRLPLR